MIGTVVAMTRRIHPAPLRPAPMDPKFFIKRVPQSLIAVMGAGLLIGAFYGLAPLYASQQGLSTELVGWYMGCCIFAGLLAQWPLGWLSDRYDRPLLIRVFALLLCAAALPLAIFPQVPVEVLFVAGFVSALGYLKLTDAGVAARDESVMRHCLGHDQTEGHQKAVNIALPHRIYSAPAASCRNTCIARSASARPTNR